MKQMVIVVLRVILFLSLALTFWVLCRTYLIDRITIRGHSMEPSFHEGERVWVSKVAVSRKKVKAGDVLVFRDRSDDHFLCKRCIAAPGDSILYIRSRLDTTLYSTLLYAPASFPRYASAIAWETGVESGFRTGYRFQQDWFYFLGDNRNHSVDSRHFGLVPGDCLFGKIIHNQLL